MIEVIHLSVLRNPKCDVAGCASHVAFVFPRSGHRPPKGITTLIEITATRFSSRIDPCGYMFFSPLCCLNGIQMPEDQVRLVLGGKSPGQKALSFCRDLSSFPDHNPCYIGPYGLERIVVVSSWIYWFAVSMLSTLLSLASAAVVVSAQDPNYWFSLCVIDLFHSRHY
jgi:hypothetical protein